jgi:hypothetical protein
MLQHDDAERTVAGARVVAERQLGPETVAAWARRQRDRERGGAVGGIDGELLMPRRAPPPLGNDTDGSGFARWLGSD